MEKSYQVVENYIREEELSWHSLLHLYLEMELKIAEALRTAIILKGIKNTNKFSAANPIGFKYIILMSCVA